MKRGVILLIIVTGISAAEAKVDLVTLPSRDGEEGVTGSFRLEKDVYLVGEPIFAVFEVINNGQKSFSFDVGGDYRRWPAYHRRFSVVIRNSAGREFTYPPTGHAGGIGNTITLGPRGEKYLEYVLLSSRVHLLPPGEYVVEINRTLDIDYEAGTEIAPVTVDGKLRFTVNAYDFPKLKKALLELGSRDRTERKGAKRYSIRQIHWALSDVSRKFNMGLSSATKDLREEVIKNLPQKWNDEYYLEANIDFNRNWLTGSDPEEYILTFTITNNSNKTLESGVLGCHVYVDGKEIEDWKNILSEALEDKQARYIAAGATLEFSHRFNRYVQGTGTHQVVWQINDVASAKTVVNVKGDGA